MEPTGNPDSNDGWFVQESTDGDVRFVHVNAEGVVDQSSDRTLGNTDKCIREACMWMVEASSDAAKSDKLSEGAHYSVCRLAKQEFNGVDPKVHREMLLHFKFLLKRYAVFATCLKCAKEEVETLSKKQQVLHDKYSALLHEHCALTNKETECVETLLEEKNKKKDDLSHKRVRTDASSATSSADHQADSTWMVATSALFQEVNEVMRNLENRSGSLAGSLEMPLDSD